MARADKLGTWAPAPGIIHGRRPRRLSFMASRMGVGRTPQLPQIGFLLAHRTGQGCSGSTGEAKNNGDRCAVRHSVYILQGLGIGPGGRRVVAGSEPGQRRKLSDSQVNADWGVFFDFR